MRTDWLRYTLFFSLLVMLQIWVFNRIHIFHYFTPLFYVYFILKLPADMGRNALLITVCFLGFLVDFFSYTLGFNMLACTITGFLRYYIFNVFAPRDMIGFFVPSVETFGLAQFLKYATSLVLIHHVILFSTEIFTLFDPLTLFIKISGSVVLTILLILGTEQLKLDFLKK